MSVSKRRQYRVTGEDLDGILVALRVGEQDTPVQLIDISAAGAALAFADTEKPQVEALLRSTRQPPVVIIDSGALEEELTIQCRFAHIQAVPAGVICGVAFLRQIDDTFNLEGALLRIFNRRGAVRIEPDPDVQLVIHLETPSGNALGQGRLKDLSLTGLGILVSPDQMKTLPNGTNIMLRFSLREEAFEMPATVRFGTVRTELRPGGLAPEDVGVAGLEFDAKARNNANNRKRLASWIMWRQRETRRIQRELEEGIGSA
jgi:hypothetical protein